MLMMIMMVEHLQNIQVKSRSSLACPGRRFISTNWQGWSLFALLAPLLDLPPSHFICK